MWTAITREASPERADRELPFVDRTSRDIARAQRQDEAYCHALEAPGCAATCCSIVFRTAGAP
jgi:hypothetical protein